MHPSRRAILLVTAGVVVAALPVLVGPGLWGVWVFGWTLGLLSLVIDGLLVVRADELSHALSLPDSLYMGDAAELRLRLSVAGRAVNALVKLDLSDGLEPVAPQRVRLGASGGPRDRAPTRELRFVLRPRRRGRVTVEAAWLRCSGPLGLIERTVRLAFDAPIDAVPNLRAVRRLALEVFSPSEVRAGLRIERYTGDGTEFDSLREFMPGLDHRAIDWKASARHTQLLCRQFRAERDRQIIVAVDAGRLMAEPLAGIPRLDHAIHAALLLAYLSVRAGDRVGLFSFADRPGAFSEPRPGLAAFRATLKLSGAIAYSDAETNYTLGLTELMGRLHRRSLIVVLTDFVDTTTAELMLDNVTRLARRHLVVFVALRDPLLDEIAAAEPRDLRALERAIVAESLSRERELVVARLRRHGVLCVDAAPARVGVELVNHYLEIKHREMI